MIKVTRHIRTTIRHDGPALAGHDLGVQDLAPALLALADIVQMANRRVNGDKADMRVVVNADVEQQCFMSDLGLVQSLVDQAKGLFSAEHIHTAKEIAADIELVTGVLPGGELHTNELNSYRGLHTAGYRHMTVNHGSH